MMFKITYILLFPWVYVLLILPGLTFVVGGVVFRLICGIVS